MSKVLLDGDIVAYRSAYSTEDMEPEDCEHKVDELIDDVMGFTLFEFDHNMVEVFLTGPTNFRYELATIAPYKGNRKDSVKPRHLSHARDYLIEEYGAVVSVDEEADDMIAKRATELGRGTVIASVDKDFLQVPVTFFNMGRREFTEVSEFDAHYNFYTQVLTGDRADNIKGLANIGPKKAERALEGATTEEELYARVYDMYDGDTDALLENARLLWLRRKEDQLWLPPDQR